MGPTDTCHLLSPTLQSTVSWHEWEWMTPAQPPVTALWLILWLRTWERFGSYLHVGDRKAVEVHRINKNECKGKWESWLHIEPGGTLAWDGRRKRNWLRRNSGKKKKFREVQNQWVQRKNENPEEGWWFRLHWAASKATVDWTINTFNKVT